MIMAVQDKGRIQKRKVNVTVTISPYLKKQLDEMVDSEEFSSLSDLATMAFTEFVTIYNLKKNSKECNNSKTILNEDDTHVEHYIVD